jgi:hypothetical protein
LSPAAAAHAAETAAYAQTIRKLGLWFVLFAAMNAGLGTAGLIHGLLDHGAFSATIEPWPHPPMLEWTYTGGIAWLLLSLRMLLALMGGAALRVQAPWGRRLATVSAAVAVTQFPIGLLFGIYALVRLMGPRNAARYAAITGPVHEQNRKLQPH